MKLNLSIASWDPSLYEQLQRLRAQVFRLDDPREGNYWLHLETDSVVVRAEVEELLLLLNDGNELLAEHQPVLCIYAMSTFQDIWPISTRRVTCGDIRASAGIARHTANHINVYTWNRARRQIVLSSSQIGGVYGNDRFMSSPHRRTLGGMCAADPKHPRRTNESLCASMPGVGWDYWSRLFANVGNIPAVKRKAPDAIVIKYSDHWPHSLCNEVHLYARHVDFCLHSLRSVYDGPVIWRAMSPPRFWPPLPPSPQTGEPVPCGECGMQRCSELQCDLAFQRKELAEVNCLSVESIASLDRIVRKPLLQHGMRVVETAQATEDWGGASDHLHIHFDGGLLRRLHAISEINVSKAVVEQTASARMLRNLLEALADAIPPHSTTAKWDDRPFPGHSSHPDPCALTTSHPSQHCAMKKSGLTPPIDRGGQDPE